VTKILDGKIAGATVPEPRKPPVAKHKLSKRLRTTPSMHAQACSPSAQIKAATAQVHRLNRIRKKKS